MSTTTELHRKDAELQAVRAELVALRAGVSALADEWDLASRQPGPAWSDVIGKNQAAAAIRNLLGADS